MTWFTTAIFVRLRTPEKSRQAPRWQSRRRCCLSNSSAGAGAASSPTPASDHDTSISIELQSLLAVRLDGLLISVLITGSCLVCLSRDLVRSLSCSSFICTQVYDMVGNDFVQFNICENNCYRLLV